MKQALNFQILVLAIIGCALILANCSDVEVPYLPPPELAMSSPSLSSDGSSSSKRSSSSSSSSSLNDNNSSSPGGGIASSSSQAPLPPPPSLAADEFLDTRDNTKYKYEIYSGRAWMSENLNYSKGGTIGWCYGTGNFLGNPGDDLPGCDSPFGRNYTYAIAMDGNSLRGICPAGWHIPSVTEWIAIGAVQGTSGGYSYMSDGFYVYAGNFNTNSAWPPLGWKDRKTTSSTGSGFYWTSNASNYFAYMESGGKGFQIRSDANGAGVTEYFSVRCVMDEGGKLPCGSSLYDPVTELCADGVKYPIMCGGKKWDPKLQQCNSDVLTCLPTLPSGYFCSGNDVYQTITVGSQTWMASNLNGGPWTWAAAMALTSACNSSNCATSIQTPHQGICPAGWHIPTQIEITSDAFFASSSTWWTATQYVSDWYAYYKDTYGDVTYSSKTTERPARCVRDD